MVEVVLKLNPKLLNDSFNVDTAGSSSSMGTLCCCGGGGMREVVLWVNTCDGCGGGGSEFKCIECMESLMPVVDMGGSEVRNCVVSGGAGCCCIESRCSKDDAGGDEDGSLKELLGRLFPLSLYFPFALLPLLLLSDTPIAKVTNESIKGSIDF